jgi:hypothetical protein
VEPTPEELARTLDETVDDDRELAAEFDGTANDGLEEAREASLLAEPTIGTPLAPPRHRQGA